ncbi:MAG: hypothetical protein DRQ61_04190 [Gammaproteobacteria bacterium]|nr:MAG: hypothetical protein DRQ61_04190 [Gammaproteobacteria bacterium]
MGIGLKKQGYDVTIVTNRAGREIKEWNILLSQIIFDMARQPYESIKPYLRERQSAKEQKCAEL